MIPTVIRGHLATPGSPAEAHLVAWSELLDSTPDPDALRASLADTQRLQRERETQADPYWREWYSRRGWGWPAYRAQVRALATAIPVAEERHQEVAACLLRAEVAEGYLGREA